MVGIESKNVNFKADALSCPQTLAILNVIPLRLTPGIVAKICERPIKIADLYDKLFISFF